MYAIHSEVPHVHRHTNGHHDFRVHIERALCPLPDSNRWHLDKLRAHGAGASTPHGREHIGEANDWEGLRDHLPNLFVDFSRWHVRARIANKSIPIGHFHARHGRFVQFRFFADNSVQVENERRNRIGLVGRKTSGRGYGILR
jgi:hypothetical protein